MFLSLSVSAQERELVWPKGLMPDPQEHQIAAMTNEVAEHNFKPQKHATAYLEWLAAPEASVSNGACMILISGGSHLALLLATS